MWSRSGTASDRSAKAVSRSASGCGSAAVGDCNRFTTILGTLCICRLQPSKLRKRYSAAQSRIPANW
jgi:hypothetical protein